MRPRYCTCERPTPTRDYPDSCYCGRYIRDWPALFAEFFDRLEATVDESDRESFLSFRRQCEAREMAGRETFGQAFLRRHNHIDSFEEFSDGGLYINFASTLEDPDPHIDLALACAWHAWKAREFAARHAAAHGKLPGQKKTHTD